MNPSERIDKLIAELTDWRGETLAGIRKSILEADQEIIEEWKWMGSPVWSRDGMIAVGNAHKDKVKLTFAHGASLPDPETLQRRPRRQGSGEPSICSKAIRSTDRALKNLVRAAIHYNQGKLKEQSARTSKESELES